MSTFTIIMLIIIAILGIALIALSIIGKKAQKKQEAQKEQLDAVAQNVSMLIIDKKRMKIKQAGFPSVVVENTPRLMRASKVPVVKAKIGPKIMTLMCDEKVFSVLPIKKEVKCVVSGIYITAVKSVRGGSLETPPKKRSFFRRR